MLAANYSGQTCDICCPFSLPLECSDVIRWLANLLYGSVPAEFPSAFTMQESVDRLKGSIEYYPGFLIAIKEAATGTVSENKVSLSRERPMFRNSFKPFFVGRFEFREGRVVLVGRFTMHFFVKAFMTFWLGFCLYWTAMAAFTIAQREPSYSWVSLGGIGLLGIGVAFVRVAQFLSSDDVTWLSALIARALSGANPGNA